MMKKLIKQTMLILFLVMIFSYFGKAPVSNAADTIITGGKNKQSAIQLTKYNTPYASEITSQNSDSWFYIITANEDAYYNFYVKNVSLSPVSIDGHTQGAHVHVYSELGEKIVNISAIYNDATANESVKLERNTKYYINIHAGSYLSCESTSVGFIRLQINCNKDNVKDDKSSATPIKIDQIITNTLDGTGDDDWFSFSTGNSTSYRMYLKNYGLTPNPIDGHYYCLHMHLYSNLGENIATIYGDTTTISENIQLEKNTQYFIVLHSGLGEWADCDGDGTSIPTGKYSFSIFPKENLPKYCSHEYKQTVVPSTYTQSGYTLHICKKCGKKYKNNYTSKKTLAKGFIWSRGGLVAGKKSFTVSYRKINDVSGYQIRYSTNKQFKNSVKIVSTSKTTTRKTIKKLQKKRYYYVQVRGFKKTSGKTIYGEWSTKCRVKTR